MAGVVAVVGVGAGVGSAVASRFARAGYTVALLGRNADNLRPIEEEIRKAGGAASSFVADAASPQSLRDAFAAIQKSLGVVDVLVYNAGPAFARKSILDLDASVRTPRRRLMPGKGPGSDIAAPGCRKRQLLEEGFKAGCTGALVAAQQVLPGMIAKKKGTILFTGATASLRGGENFVALAAPKAALRMLGQRCVRGSPPDGGNSGEGGGWGGWGGWGRARGGVGGWGGWGHVHRVRRRPKC